MKTEKRAVFYGTIPENAAKGRSVMKTVPKKEKARAAALVCLTAAAVFGIKASQVQNDEILPVSAAGPSSSDAESSSSSPAKEKIPGEKAELHPTDAAQQLSSGQLELLYDFLTCITKQWPR